MKSELSRSSLSDLEWVDVSCTIGNWFVCEKLQPWSIEHLQEIVLGTRRELQHLNDSFTNYMTDMRNEITDLRNSLLSQITDIRNSLTSLTNQVTNTSNSVTNLTNK